MRTVLYFILSVSIVYGSSGFTDFLKLLNDDEDVRLDGVRAIVTGADTSRWAALLDMLYFKALPTEAYEMMNRAAGVRYGRNWPRWMEWLGVQSIRMSRDYRRFKQLLFSQIDPAFSAFLNPDLPTTIRWDEIVWGGVKKDGIPALDDPVMIAADAAGWLDEDEPVFGLVVDDEARAFPLRIMDWHELANLTYKSGRLVVLSYCPLCGAAIAYDASLGGRRLRFGTSGSLYRSNKLMYDRETHSLWSAMTGKPVAGLLVSDSIRLQPLPVERTQWADWRRRHPRTTVLSRNTGYRRVYKRYSGYYRYFKSSKTMFPVAQRDNRLPAKTIVFGMHLNGISKAWPLQYFREGFPVNDSFGGQSVVLLGSEKKESVRAYVTAGEKFVQISRDMLKDGNGNMWRIRDAALVETQTGRKYPRYPGHLAYWFGWYAFYPETLLYESVTD